MARRGRARPGKEGPGGARQGRGREQLTKDVVQ